MPSELISGDTEEVEEGGNRLHVLLKSEVNKKLKYQRELDSTGKNRKLHANKSYDH